MESFFQCVTSIKINFHLEKKQMRKQLICNFVFFFCEEKSGNINHLKRKAQGSFASNDKKWNLTRRRMWKNLFFSFRYHDNEDEI